MYVCGCGCVCVCVCVCVCACVCVCVWVHVTRLQTQTLSSLSSPLLVLVVDSTGACCTEMQGKGRQQNKLFQLLKLGKGRVELMETTASVD